LISIKKDVLAYNKAVAVRNLLCRQVGASRTLACPFFESMAEAAKEGKKALGHFLAKQAA
jgi:hypothetical protein